MLPTIFCLLLEKLNRYSSNLDLTNWMYHIMPFRVTMLVGKLTTMVAYYKKARSSFSSNAGTYLYNAHFVLVISLNVYKFRQIIIISNRWNIYEIVRQSQQMFWILYITRRINCCQPKSKLRISYIQCNRIYYYYYC